MVKRSWLGLCLVLLSLTLLTGQVCSSSPPGGDDGTNNGVGPGDGDDGTDDDGDGDDQATGTLALFDEVWNEFDQTYSYFVYKGIDWDALRTQYRPNFEQELSGNEFADELANMLRELEDLHVNVQQPDGSYVEVYTRDAAQNYTTTPRNRYAPDGYQTLGDNVIHHGLLENNVAYIRVDTLSTDAFEPISDADIEDLFVNYADANGMIIDIRPNNGGNENNAMKFASRFIDEPVVYGYYQYRNGPGHDDFDSVEEKVLEPSTGTHYYGLVICLIGERCLSSAEWFTLMMRAGGAVLIGDTTRGSSGNPQTFTLSNDVSYSVPRWIAYTDDMEEIEDRGIDPAFPIAPEDSFDESADYVVEEALEWFAPL